ncbi:MAG TPA: hypothetical protein VEB64_14750 [Azospirillaceae bacterium]|nr:hypothetical protein [Azospirillaceae bacterium]
MEPEILNVSIDPDGGRLARVRIKVGPFAVDVPVMAPDRGGFGSLPSICIIDREMSKTLDTLARKAFADAVAKRYGGTR